MTDYLPMDRRRPQRRDGPTGQTDPADGNRPGHDPASPIGGDRRDSASRSRFTLQLQQQLGNRRTGSVLGLGQGKALEPHLRSAAEQAYRTDFGDVRVHTDERAAAVAGSHDARAVTFGRSIAFGSGEYRPGSFDHDVVLAHELAHVAQQSPDRAAGVDPSADELEADADRSAVAGAGALRGDVLVPGAAAPTLRSALQLRRCGGRADPRVAAPPTSALAVSGAARFAADGYVTTTGSVVTVTITGVAAPGTSIPAGTVTWTGGMAGADQLHRLVPTGSPGAVTVTARGGGRSGAVTVHVVAATPPPAANPPATLRHLLHATPAVPPSNATGITVTTIGQQGVTGPELDITAYLDGAVWRFRVTEIRHRYKVGVHPQGRTNISGPGDPAITPDTIGLIIADLTPPGPGAAHGPPRTRFGSMAITRAHEEAHVNRFYTQSWPPRMRTLESEIEAASVPFDPATRATAAAAVASQLAAWQERANRLHEAADVADFNGTEVAAHGVSNPMYAALVDSIRDTVAPPAPARLTASPGTHNTFLTWRPANVVNTTGFVVQRRIGSGPFVDVATVAANVRTYTDRHVPAGSVTYQVLAVGVAGRSAPSPAEVVTISP